MGSQKDYAAGYRRQRPHVSLAALRDMLDALEAVGILDGAGEPIADLGKELLERLNHLDEAAI